MRISDLIEQLLAVKARSGDLRVYHSDSHWDSEWDTYHENFRTHLGPKIRKVHLTWDDEGQYKPSTTRGVVL